MRRILFFPDAQIPYHNPLMLRSLIRFIHDWQPDEVCIIGDFMDYPTPSQWTKGTRGEFEGSVFADSELGKRTLGAIRKGFFGDLTFVEGNHDLRPRVYLAKYAPALAESKAFHACNLLDFDGHGVADVSGAGLYSWAPNWGATHGHLGFTLSPIAGRTAALGALKVGKSLVMGHTHKLGIVPETKGYDGITTTYTGVEVGHIMDTRPGRGPKYLKLGMANWQAGFAYAYVNGKDVYPHIVRMKNDGSFVFEGKVHTAKEESIV